MKIRLPFTRHPSRIEFRHGILKEDVCEKIKPQQWEAVIDSNDPLQVEQGKSWIGSRTIDILGATPRLLANIEPGFDSQRTQDVFAELKAATKKAGKVSADLQQARQGVSCALAIQESNIDPAQVPQNRKGLKEQRESLEDSQVLAGTYERNIDYLWSQLFQSLTDFQAAQVAAVKEKLVPIVEEVNAVNRSAAKLWQLKGEPLLRQLAEMNPKLPGSIYYEHLHFTDFQVRQIKNLEAFPQIRINGNRFEFTLGVLGYVKK